MVSAVVPLGLLAAGIGAGYVLAVRWLTDQMVVSRTAGAVAVFPILRVLAAGLVVAIGWGVGRWAMVTMLAGLAAGQTAAFAVIFTGRGHGT